MWARICNLQMECNIPPLYSRITALNVCVIAKVLSQPSDATSVNRVKIEIRRKPNFPIPKTWIAGCEEMQPLRRVAILDAKLPQRAI